MTRLPREPTCRDVADLLADYLAQQLDPDARTRFAAHLDACPECVAYLRAYEDTIRLAKDVGARADDPLPDALPEALVRAILATRPRKDT